MDPSDAPLPPGWTQERLDTASIEEISALPPKDRKVVADRIWQDFLSKQKAERVDFRVHFHEAANAERLSQGRPPRIALPAKLTDPEDDEPPELVDVVVVNGYKQAWGFLIFRTDYKNEVAWQTFENKFNMLVTTSLKIGKPGKPGEPIVGRDYQRIASGKTIKVITSPSLQGASVLDVIRSNINKSNKPANMLCIVSYSHFRDLVKKGSVPEGLNPHMCLMVDAATLTSFPESKANSVLAVDVGYSPNSPRNPPGYKGYFPVAVESLLPRLYPVLASQYLSPVRAWGYANPIFDKVE